MPSANWSPLSVSDAVIDAVIDPRDLHDAIPGEPSGTGILLLAGSSGRIETARADLLAGAGARVRAIRWFGGAGQRPIAHEVPLELFAAQLDALRRDCDRVLIFGTSFGAEAALVTAATYPVDGVIAAAPSSVVWAATDGESWSSHWTRGGAPMPYVSFDPDWMPDSDPPAFASLYTSSLRLDPAATEAARIRVEDIPAELLLVAGEDDQVWPSAHFAAQIAAVREAHALPTTVVTHQGAGHRMVLPGEEPASGGVRMRRGGTPTADAELGARAWPHITRMIRHGGSAGSAAARR